MRFSLGMLVGAVAMAVVVFFAGAKTGYLMGVATVLVPVVLYPGKGAKVLEWVAVRMEKGKGWGQGQGTRKGPGQGPGTYRFPVTVPDRSGYRKPSRKQQDQILQDTVEEYLS